MQRHFMAFYKVAKQFDNAPLRPVSFRINSSRQAWAGETLLFVFLLYRSETRLVIGVAILMYFLTFPFLSLESILLRMACILCLITVANCGTPSPTRPGLCQLLQLLNPLFVI